jgi:hypothetical protein
MADYVINYSTGNITLTPGNSNVSAGLLFMGQNYANYGQSMNQNWMSLAEHYASNATGPTTPVRGQLWYDSNNSSLKLNTSSTIGIPTWQTVLTSPNSNGNVSFDVVNANSFIGNGFRLFSLNGANISKVQSSLTADTAGTVTTGAQPNITSVGTLTSLTSTGNVTANNFIGNFVGNFVVPGANTQVIYNLNGGAAASSFFTYADDTKTLTVSGGRVIAGSFTGNGANLSSINAANINGTVANATYALDAGNAINASSALTAVTVTNNAQPNITSIGTLSQLLVSGPTFTNSLSVNTSSNTASLSVSGAATISSLTAQNILSGNTIITLGPVPTGPTSTTLGAVMNYQNEDGTRKAFMGLADTVDNDTIFVFATNCTITGNIIDNLTLGNATLDSLYTTGLVKTNYITTGSAATPGTIQGNWSLASGSRLTATYADLAERFEADAVYEPGTVVELGGEREITAVKYELSEDVFGVISNTAAYLMNAGAGTDETHPPVAMTGRVEIKVKGKVKKGDRLVSAGAGYARAARRGEANAFNTIGRSLVDKTNEDIGVVLATVVVSR